MSRRDGESKRKDYIIVSKIPVVNHEWQAVKEYTLITIVLTVVILLGCLCNSCKADELWRISHYCACQKCCGKDVNDKAYGIMASGHKVYQGAVACNWLPFSSKLLINDKIYTVEDRGAKSIFGDRNYHKKAIDIYCNNHQEALRKGIYYAEVKILDYKK